MTEIAPQRDGLPQKSQRPLVVGPATSLHPGMLRPLLALAVLAALVACDKPADAPLPPSGLAGVPGAPIPVDPMATMPAGHPPIDGAHAMQGGGGDDGAPIPAKAGAQPLPNLPGMNSGAAPGGTGGGAGAGVVFSGKVLEKVDVPGYTYMRVQVGGAEEWVAVSTMPVNLGDTITVNQQMVMENFPSKSLNRTFDRLVMGSAFVGG